MNLSQTKQKLSNNNIFAYPSECDTFLLDKDKILYAFENLRKIIFPHYFEKIKVWETIESYISRLIDETSSILVEQIVIVIKTDNIEEKKQQAEIIVEKFFNELPNVASLLNSDIDATFNNDPAAECKSQIILSYPGITAITFYRLAHILFELKVSLIPRIVTEYAHSLTGIDIHPGAKIGASFCIDHGTGIVIGETTIIGNNVKVYQGVTLGALSIKNRESTINKKRHPTIENNVTLYAGCTVLGGETVIGENSIIGGSAFIVKSIEKNTLVSMELPKLKLKSYN